MPGRSRTAQLAVDNRDPRRIRRFIQDPTHQPQVGRGIHSKRRVLVPSDADAGSIRHGKTDFWGQENYKIELSNEIVTGLGPFWPAELFRQKIEDDYLR
jgi:hypothetical protein